MDIKEIVENFTFLEEWEDKYEYLINLGKRLPDMDETMHCEMNRISGCISNVWIVLEKHNNKIVMHADSDAQIVKGLLAVLKSIAESDNPKDVRKIFTEIGLSEQLTPNRRNGLNAAITHLEQFIEANT